MTNLQKKVTEIYNLPKDTRNIQIKGTKQPEDLNSSAEIMSDKFDQYEKVGKEKRKHYNWLTEWGDFHEENNWLN